MVPYYVRHLSRRVLRLDLQSEPDTTVGYTHDREGKLECLHLLAPGACIRTTNHKICRMIYSVKVGIILVFGHNSFTAGTVDNIPFDNSPPGPCAVNRPGVAQRACNCPSQQNGKRRAPS